MSTLLAVKLSLALSLASAALSYGMWSADRTRRRSDVYTRRLDIYIRTVAFWSLLVDWIPDRKEHLNSSFEHSPALLYAKKLFDKACHEATVLFSGDPRITYLMQQLQEDLAIVVAYRRDIAPEFKGSFELIPFYNQEIAASARVIEAIISMRERLEESLHIHQMQTFRGTTVKANYHVEIGTKERKDAKT